MKSIKLRCASALAALMALFSVPSVLRLGLLKDFAKPFVGEYACESIQIGNRDFTKQLEAKLEIGGDGNSVFRWKNVFGKEQSKSFPYEYDEERQALILLVPEGRGEKRVALRLEKGEVLIAESLSGRALIARFSRK